MNLATLTARHDIPDGWRSGTLAPPSRFERWLNAGATAQAEIPAPPAPIGPPQSPPEVPPPAGPDVQPPEVQDPPAPDATPPLREPPGMPPPMAK